MKGNFFIIAFGTSFSKLGRPYEILKAGTMGVQRHTGYSCNPYTTADETRNLEERFLRDIPVTHQIQSAMSEGQRPVARTGWKFKFELFYLHSTSSFQIRDMPTFWSVTATIAS
jgi:hypothetical protein